MSACDVGEPAGGGERLDQRPAAGKGQVAGRAHGADDQDRPRARLAHLDRNGRAIDVFRLEQRLQLLREAGLGQPFGRHLADERQVDLAVLGHPDLDVQLRHLIDLDGDLVLGTEAVAHRRPGGQDLGVRRRRRRPPSGRRAAASRPPEARSERGGASERRIRNSRVYGRRRRFRDRIRTRDYTGIRPSKLEPVSTRCPGRSRIRGWRGAG